MLNILDFMLLVQWWINYCTVFLLESYTAIVLRLSVKEIAREI